MRGRAAWCQSVHSLVRLAFAAGLHGRGMLGENSAITAKPAFGLCRSTPLG